MSNVERYEALMRAALEAQQLKVELRRKLSEVAKNITANELKHRGFNNEAAQKAFAILADGMIEIKPASHVKAHAVYKDVSISLFQGPDHLGGEAMKHVLSDLANNEIFET